MSDASSAAASSSGGSPGKSGTGWNWKGLKIFKDSKYLLSEKSDGAVVEVGYLPPAGVPARTVAVHLGGSIRTWQDVRAAACELLQVKDGATLVLVPEGTTAALALDQPASAATHPRVALVSAATSTLSSPDANAVGGSPLLSPTWTSDSQPGRRPRATTAMPTISVTPANTAGAAAAGVESKSSSRKVGSGGAPTAAGGPVNEFTFVDLDDDARRPLTISIADRLIKFTRSRSPDQSETLGPLDYIELRPLDTEKITRLNLTAEAANRAFRLVGPLGRSSLALQAPTPADIQTFNIWLRYYRRSRVGGSAMRSGPSSAPLVTSPAPGSTGSVTDDFEVVSHVALHPPAKREKGQKRAGQSRSWKPPESVTKLPSHIARYRELRDLLDRRQQALSDAATQLRQQEHAMKALLDNLKEELDVNSTHHDFVQGNRRRTQEQQEKLAALNAQLDENEVSLAQQQAKLYLGRDDVAPAFVPRRRARPAA